MTLAACSKFGNSKEDVKAEISKSSIEENIPVIVCGEGTSLNSQSQCIVNTPSSDSSSVDSQLIVQPSPLVPPPATNIVCNAPSGVFTELYYRQRNFISGFLCGGACKADVLGMFRYQGNCPADVYIEAGIPNAPISISPLSIAPSGYLFAAEGKPSACDGNVHFNGIVFKQVQPNQVVVFELQPEHYGVEGSYGLGVGAYTGCLKDNGKEIQVPTQRMIVGFSNNYMRGTLDNRDIDQSWVKVI